MLQAVHFILNRISKKIGTNTFFILRVTATINEVKELLIVDLILETCSNEHYSCYAVKKVIEENKSPDKPCYRLP